ncbi:MAG: S-layer homology domain-containing protein [Oscillospiraceae bacterium]|nr:S-layer homology domain-containing protein [Oscillospiraceae bacterium]
MTKKLSRIVALMLAVIMSFSMLLIPAEAASYVDVKDGAWYAEAVEYVSERGWMTGVSDTSFAPNAQVTRAMMVTVLTRVADVGVDNIYTAFVDVAPCKWYTGAAAWAAKQDIVSGVGNNRFAPNRAITRQDLCTILYAYIQAAGIELENTIDRTFSDMASVSAYAREAVQYCTGVGLIAGFDDSTFRPKNTTTRAQLAQILMRLDLLRQPKQEEPEPTPTWPMPAQNFNGEAGEDISITVNAPEGALPENSDMSTTRVTDNAVLATITADIGTAVFAAADISFFRDGEEVEPSANVEVQLLVDGLETLKSPVVLHVKDDGTVEYISSDLVSVNRGGQKALRFFAKDFSIYVIVDGSTLPEARATVNFYRSLEEGAEPVRTYYVKNSDTLEEMEAFFTDPGVGDVLSENQLFAGWTIDEAAANVNGADENYDTEHYGKNYSTTTRAYSVDKIRTYLEKRAMTDGDVINIYAMIYGVFTVTYIDKTGVTLASENAIMLPSETEATYVVSQDYTVLSQEENFEGWIPQKDSNGDTHVVMEEGKEPTYDGEEVSEPYPQGTVMVIDGDVTFSNDVSKGHWLVFEENGYGATYNAPIFIKQEEVTREPDLEMTRPGYTFDGWWTGAPASEGAAPTGEEFVFGNKITDRTVLYAKWIQSPTASYTVVIWKQNINGDGYDFVAAVPMTGSTTDPVNPVTNTSETSCTVNGQTYSYDGFHLGQYDTDVNVKPAGGTVAHVHFDRNEHELQFQVQMSAGYYEVSDPDWDAWANSEVDYYFYASNGTRYTLDVKDNQDYFYHSFGTTAPTVYGNQSEGTYFLLIDNTVYSLRRQDRTWQAYYNGTWTNVNQISGTKYYLIRSSTANPTVYEYHAAGWTTIKTIKALYEQNIGDNFPIVGTNGTTYNNGERWDPQSDTPYSEVLIYIDVMPDADVTFHLDTADHSTKTIHYYVEALPNETPTRTYRGMGFVEYKSVDANYNFFTEAEDYIDLVGFYKGGENGTDYPPEAYSSNGNAQNNIWRNSSARNVYCYYTRRSYDIAFWDGLYVDGRNNKLDISSAGFYKNSAKILYGADITSYNKDGDDYYVPNAQTGFVFEGWYYDETCTQPCTFTTMPLNGVKVYAKWRQIEYRVFLHPNATINGVRDETLDWGSESQATNFRIAYNGKVSIPSGLRTGYEFIGWYTDEALTVPYNKDTRLTDDTVPATPAYDKTKDMTDNIATQEDPETHEVDNIPMDKWGLLTDAGINKDVNRGWITRKLDLYCKWSKVLEGSKGIYVAYDSNCSSPNPTDALLYKENGIAVAQEAVTPDDPENEQFLYWVMQKYNDATGEYADIEGSIIYPGANFNVQAENAKIEPLLDDNNNPVVDNEGRAQMVYTVQLRAEFGPITPPAPTHVIWYGNGGTLDGTTTGGIENEYVESDETPVNAPIPIEPDLFTHPAGYVFMGWVKLSEQQVINFNQDKTIASFNPQEVAEDDVWLKFNVADADHANNYFTVHNDDPSIEGRPVTHVGADEKTPYDVMVAVWSTTPYYYVFHSSTGIVEARPLIKGEKVNLQSMVPTGYLYGGYYKNYAELDSTTVFNATFKAVYAADKQCAVEGAVPYDGSVRSWKRADAYKASEEADIGTNLSPQGSVVYYLKEVPDSYLQNKIVYIRDYHNKNKIIDIYLLNVIDDVGYSYLGYELDGTDIPRTELTVASTFTVKTKDWGSLTITAHDMNTKLSNGYLIIKQLGADAVAAYNNGTFAVDPKWKTLDGVEVTQNHLTYILDDGPYKITWTDVESRHFDGTEKMYFNLSPSGTDMPSWWSNSGCKQMVDFFMGDANNAAHNWVELTKESGNIYSCTVPAGYWSTIILVRAKEEATGDYFNSGNQYNQSKDNPIPMDKDMDYLTGFYENGYQGNGTCTWDTYNPSGN